MIGQINTTAFRGNLYFYNISDSYRDMVKNNTGIMRVPTKYIVTIKKDVDNECTVLKTKLPRKDKITYYVLFEEASTQEILEAYNACKDSKLNIWL